MWQRNLDVFRKYSLPSLVGPSIGEPLLYLLGLGFGLGTLVGTVGGQRYVEFVAPGMVMSSAMFAAAYECTYGAYVRMIHQKTYEAIITTPLSLEDVVAGDILWGASKGTFNGTIRIPTPSAEKRRDPFRLTWVARWGMQSGSIGSIWDDLSVAPIGREP